MDIDADRLIEACDDASLAAGVTIRTRIEPMLGAGAPIKPPIYASSSGERGAQYAYHWEWLSPDDDGPTLAVTVDNVPSQANRVEAALESMVDELGLPEIALDLTGLEPLPAHAPRRISSFRFPHRVADAYLRDSELDGTAFERTDIGRELIGASSNAPLPLLRWFPQALALGWWMSHAGTAGSQTKLARAWTSEIRGYAPAVHHEDGRPAVPRVMGVKGDPLNLSTDEPIVRNTQVGGDWAIGKTKVGDATKRDKLSEIGHGQVPFSGGEAAPSPVSCRSIVQRATLSLAGLRRVNGDSAGESALVRAVAAALVLVGHTVAHARPFSLRSGSDLRPTSTSWTWLGQNGDQEVAPLTPDAAKALLADVLERAAAADLPVGDRWEQIVVTPNPALSTAIRSTFPVVE